MSLANIPFDQISEADLIRLVDIGVSEGKLYEFKSRQYGRSDADIKEFLKDLSSFANELGGHLIVGVREEDGVAVELTPIVGISPDEELLRLESLARDGLEPRIPGLQMRVVTAAAGGLYLVLRIPKSWQGHRVSARGTNRIYGRSSAGAFELSMVELRSLFTQSSSALDRIGGFRAERLARLNVNDGIVPLADDQGRVVVHFCPMSSFAGPFSLDIERAHATRRSFWPLGTTSCSSRINFEGVINERGGDQCHGYTQIFRNGCIEATKVRATNGNGFIPSQSIEQAIIEKLGDYMDGLQSLEIPVPVVVMISLQGVYGARVGTQVRSDPDDLPPPLRTDQLELPEVIILDYGSAVSYQAAVRPAFDALWNVAGYARSQNFDVEGRWRPRT